MLILPRRKVGLLSIAAAVLLACDDLDNIDVSVEGDADIPKANLLDELLAGLPVTGFDQIDFEQRFANQGVTPDQVDSVVVKSFTLSVTAPAEGNFDFIDRVSFFASAPGQDEVRIASAEAIPAGARTIDLTLDSVELKPYATATSMTLRTEVEGQKPDVATRVHAAVVFDVDITIPGC